MRQTEACYNADKAIIITRKCTSVYQRMTLLVLALLSIAISACGAASANNPTPTPANLPTVVPSPTPEYNDMTGAVQVATIFLDHWTRGEYASMYQLISVESQQSTPYESFVATYENASDVIRLLELSYEQRVATRENDRVIALVYDMTFNSHLIGEFSDSSREMRLVLDDNLQTWRVAWSPADIFNEMVNGARLRMETFPPRRANIYDRDGEILADMNGQIVSVNVIRERIPDVTLCVNALAGALNQDVSLIESRMNNFGFTQRAEFGIVQEQVFLQWQAALETNCAAEFDNRPVRRYIDGDLMPHILGYVGYPNEEDLDALAWEGFQQDSIVGRTGLERTWNSTLAGTPGGRLSIITPAGVQLRLLGQQAASPGQSLYLTIDADLQRDVQNIMNNAYQAAPWSETSPGASAIVYDPNTGAVLAMVSYPTFDANAFNTFPVMGQQAAQEIVTAVQSDPARPQLNRPTQGGYPSGSVMKLMTAVAALDSGIYGFEDTYLSTGVWNRDIPRVDWNAGGHGRQDLSGALTVSCNSCFYEAGYQMNQVDPYLLPAYANQLGLGVLTGIERDIPESTGVIANPDTKIQYAASQDGPWTFSDAVDMSIGQGFVAVTPLQMVRMYGAVATDGTLWRPQLVDHAALLDDVSYTMTPEAMSGVGTTEEIMAFLREGLCGVTNRQGVGTAEHIFRNTPLQAIGVCGKTGTAQAPNNAPSHAWFIGYAPIEQPQIAVIVMVENSGEGSAVAAPLTRDIMNAYFFGGDDET